MLKLHLPARVKWPHLPCRISGLLALTILLLPLAAHAQAGGSPFDSGFTALQNLFTGTVAKAQVSSPSSWAAMALPTERQVRKRRSPVPLLEPASRSWR